MKNLVKLLGIVVLVAAIGLSMTSCAEEEESGGTLTITGLGAYDGKYTMAQGATAGGDMVAAAADSAGKPGKISGGKVTLNVYTSPDEGKTINNFTGSGAAVLQVGIFDSESTGGSPVAMGTVTVTFKDGSAEGAFVKVGP
jgi:hypothetical protein